MNVRAIVVDDHVAVRQGLAQILADEFSGAVVVATDQAQTAIELLEKESWNLVILDLNLPGRGGLDAIRLFKDASPATGILVYTVHPEDQFGVRALRAGAEGYITKDRPAAEFLQAVRQVASGKRYVGPVLADCLAYLVFRPTGASAHTTLSDREHQILRMIGAGKSPTDIAGELNLSIKTVSTYRARILTKLDLSTTADLIRYALEHKLVD
jgi:two-component system, NarL family, invasion response regulator UvrY